MPTELAYRENSGVNVALFWDAETNELRVCVSDSWSGDCFSLDVDGASALDVFYHPYAYASQRGIDFVPPATAADIADATDIFALERT
jgi:hypothetical protein